jgi:iron-only hydrogenase group A
VFNIEVNNNLIEAKPGEFILSTLKRAGIKVPTLCHLEGLIPSGACRMCVVEVEGMHDLIPSCAFPVSDGMKIKTHSARVVKARKTIVELLLSNHPDDCLYCVRNENCELQKLAKQHGVIERTFAGEKNKYFLDMSSPSIVRDPSKCILCGRCVRVCEETQGVSAIDFIGRGSKTRIGTAFDEGLNISSCINCGQCIMVCPTAALRGQRYIEEVQEALRDPKKHVVIQHAPAVSVTLGETLNCKNGADVNGIMTSALRTLGFDRVFETSFSADLTIMEEASELVQRIKTGGTLPMFTSCSPGWVKFLEQFYPEFIPNLSTCKSPQMMLGAMIKSYYAEIEGIDPDDIYNVSVMPCVAKKFEAGRQELSNNGKPDIDAVLTTRELAMMIETSGIEANSLSPSIADNPFGERSTAGKLFGVSGGVMEAAIRTANFLLTGYELEQSQILEIRGLDGIKETKVQLGDLTLGVAVVSGLNNARKILEQIKKGRNDLHFIEVMSCPGGCIAGGGQPIKTDIELIKSRMKSLYNIDKSEPVRASHDNPYIKKLYDEYLEHPLSHKSHKLLHTSYSERKVLI